MLHVYWLFIWSSQHFYGMDMTAPFYSKENWASGSLRRSPVTARKRQTHSESNQSQSGPRTHALSTHLLPALTLALWSSLHGALLLPSYPHKYCSSDSKCCSTAHKCFHWTWGQCSSKRTPCLALNICTDNTFLYQVSSYKMLVSPRRLTWGHHPSLALPEFSQVHISHQWRFCRNQLLFKFETVFNFNWEQTANEYLLYSGQDMPSLIKKYYVATKIIQCRPIRGNMHAKLW